MQRRVVVTGMGVLSPVGCNLRQSWETILSGKSCITKIEDSEYESLPCKVAGYVQNSGGKFNLADHFSKSQLKSMGIATGYALLASKEALEDSKLELDETTKENTGVAVGMGMVDLQDICQTNDALRKGFVIKNYFIFLRYKLVFFV